MSDICPGCGHPADPHADRCERCGAPLDGDAGLDPLGRRLQARTEGRYRIVRRLGSGGMAAVYEAVDSLDRQWAIKVLSDVLLAQPEMVGRFEREARTISRLRHPHVVQLHNFEPHQDLHFLVLEFVPGDSLKDVLTEGPLPLATALKWFGQIADALDYAHRQGVIHRDIKPDNILIRPTGEAVITDFGIARDETGNTALTRPGTALGTGYYMSPEQWKGQRVDGAADQYSLGVVMWEAVAGRRPFQGETLTAVMLAHLSQDVPDLGTVRGDVPAALSAAVARMLSKDPAKRFPSVLAAALAAGVEPPEGTSAVTTPAVSATEVPTVVPTAGPREAPGAEPVAEGGPPDGAEPTPTAGGPAAPTGGSSGGDPVPATLIDHGTALTTRLQEAATAVGTALSGFGGGSLPRAARFAAGVAGLLVVSLVLYATLGPGGGGPDASGVPDGPAAERGAGPAPADGGADPTGAGRTDAAGDPGRAGETGPPGAADRGEAGADQGALQERSASDAGEGGLPPEGPPGDSQTDRGVSTGATLRIAPAGGLRLGEGETGVVTAVLVDPNGRPIETGSADWDLSDWSVARLGDVSGSTVQVEGVSGGTTEIRVSHGGLTGSLQVTVVAGGPTGDAAPAGGTGGETPVTPPTAEEGAAAVEPADVAVDLSVGDGGLLVAPSLRLPGAAAGSWCVRGEVRVGDGEWVPTEARTAEVAEDSGGLRASLPVSFEAMDLPTRGNAERTVTARVHLWPGACEGPPAEPPTHTLDAGRVCLVRYLLRDWSAEECRAPSPSPAPSSRAPSGSAPSRSGQPPPR